jgi:ABC-2 type transport system permease protein
MLPTIKINKSLPLWSQFVDLFGMELANWVREGWRANIVVGTLASLFSLIAMGIYARDNGPEALGYVLMGGVVATLLFGTMAYVQIRFITLRVSGMLEYYATLPIWRYGLILAVVAVSLVVSLPALLIVLLLGSRIFSVPLHPHPLILVILPLSILPFAGIGAIVGTTMRTIQESSSVNTAIMLGLGLLGTVAAPPELLPEVVVILGRFNPGTYTASAFRQLLLGPVTAQLGLDLVAMVGFTLLSFWFVGRRLDWKQK